MDMRRDHKRLGGLFLLVQLFVGITVAWSQDEAELVRGAKKEGKVMFWSAMRVEDNQALVAGFEARYPFIKVDVFRASSEKLVNRAVTEGLAGKMTADVLNGFALKALQNRGMLQAYRSPEESQYPAGFKDPQHHWVSLYNGYNTIGYNTKLLSRTDAPKNWPDLLAPRWKGRIGMDPEEYFWYAGMLKHWGEEKGRNYMEALARQQIQWRSGHSLLANLMSAGEFPLMTIVYPDRIEQMKANGEPVDWVRTADPILVNLGLLVIAAKAPNPNAAKLFYNYCLSKEGQTILRTRNRVSARLDVPALVPDMDPKLLRLVPLDPEIATTTKYNEEFQKVFGLK
jgi:iron(III) transport system substrate-binding protein